MYRKFKILLFLVLIALGSRAQEAYDNCGNALQLCANVMQTVNNIDATQTFCSSCEDDFAFCFSGENSVWFKFTTNAIGGDVDVNFSNLTFQNLAGQGDGLQVQIISAAIPCDPSSYTQQGSCETNIQNNFTLTAPGLMPNTTYYIVVNGTQGLTDNAECIFDITLSGLGIENNATTITIATPTASICKDEFVTFTASIANCSAQQAIMWYANGVQIGSTTSNTFTTNSLNNGDIITAQVVCFDPCNEIITSNQITMNVDEFTVSAGPDLEISAGESIQLQGETDGTTIEWQPVIFMSNPFIVDPVVNPTQTIEYYLTVSNGTCTITDVMQVVVKEELTIPNTFSPNGDKANDTWEILGIEKFPNCSVEVYNRWGQQVFKTTGYSLSKRWDGTNKGKPLASSSYFYVIDLRDDKFLKPFKGTVAIVR